MEFGEGEVSETARSGAGVLYYGDMLLVRTALSLHWNNIKGRIRGGFLEENLNGVVTRVAPRFIQFRSNFVEIDFHCVKINFVLDPEASCHFANRYWNTEISNFVVCYQAIPNPNIQISNLLTMKPRENNFSNIGNWMDSFEDLCTYLNKILILSSLLFLLKLICAEKDNYLMLDGGSIWLLFSDSLDFLNWL